jgi:hypothetical protein
VATPFAAGVFEVVAGALQGPTGGFHIGGHIALLRGAREEVGRGGNNYPQQNRQGCKPHWGMSAKIWDSEQCAWWARGVAIRGSLQFI